MSRSAFKVARLASITLLLVFAIYQFSSGKPESLLEQGGQQFDYLRQRMGGSPSAPAAYERANATFVTLAQNKDLYSLVDSVKAMEDRFNRKYHYDWVFLNDEEFNDEFKSVMRSIVSGNASFGVIPKEHWGYPDWVDLDKAAAGRKAMVAKKIIYGGSESYRHMCRFESGFFWRHPLMNQYRWYWRVEPGVKFYCDIDYDLFKFMETNDYRYGFTISMHEFRETIPTLWNTTLQFVKDHPEYVAPDNLLGFVSDDKGKTYNRCHFWSNFEVADMDFWRGPAYSQYFDYLDRTGGFFYERWGDAPVHSIAAAFFLNKTQFHHFEDLGYYHGPYTSCPTTQELRRQGRCTCDPSKNFSWKGFSCTTQYYKAQGLEIPKKS